MKCVICGSSGYDGAISQFGEHVCIDCWADGEASLRGNKATAFVPANFSLPVYYPADVQQRFLDAANNTKPDIT